MMHARHDDFAIAPVNGREAGQAEGLVAEVRRVAADWLRRAAQARENGRAAERLSRMDDRMLRDIGVTRDQAVRLARGLSD
jgi:uncharacterized protein YjiS (DUF1127 family)